MAGGRVLAEAGVDDRPRAGVAAADVGRPSSLDGDADNANTAGAGDAAVTDDRAGVSEAGEGVLDGLVLAGEQPRHSTPTIAGTARRTRRRCRRATQIIGLSRS